MYLKASRSILAGLATLLLVACGSNSGGPSQPINVFPKANAGGPQAVVSGATVTLDGTGSFDQDGSLASYAWTQTEGPAVTLSSTTTAQPTFVAPEVTTTVTLRFSLVVTDDRGAKSAASTVAITVSSVSAGVVTVSGVVRFERVPFLTTGSKPLNFAAPVLLPAREVEVQVLEATSGAPLSSGITDATGAYSFTVPGNTIVAIRVMARTVRSGRWNVRVQDGVGGLLPYSYTSPAFNSSTGTQDVTLLTGIAANGTAIPSQQRASGPFAILDTIYTSMQTILAVAPDTVFPALFVDWGAQNSGTFFSSGSDGFGPRIALLSDLTEDTDEFDQHVVAHEFGHYLEHVFSRSDSIGGPHALGDLLDMRVAFGEGFGYAFAAIVLNDTDARDSFVFQGNHVSAGFNIEVNPANGCWCSESSVWSILWDIYDVSTAVPDAPDTIELGFAPIWELMTGAQKDTPAMTSIFSFAAALKAARPGDAAGIDALLTAQNITSAGIDAFATTQASTPLPGLLPLYPVITPGNPVDVVSRGTRTEPQQLFNKAGNRAFLRFVPQTSGNVNISVVTSNTSGGASAADPDYLVWRSGTLVALQFDAPNAEPPRTETGSLNVTAGQTYIIEAFDCANGCAPTPVQGVAGDYILTVTVTNN